jgi:hypothetical protein
MVCLCAANERRVTRDEHVKTWIWHENSWEIVNVDIETSLETERCRKGRNHLSDKSVEVCVGWTLNVKGRFANVVKCLVIKIEGEVRVLKKGVSRENGVVRFHNSSGHLRRWSNGETHLGLSAEFNSEAL